MLVILEGPDGAGKSTLAKKLAEQFSAGIIHHGPYLDVRESGDLASKYLPGIRRALAGEPVIMDRCWLSEPIYGKAFRGGVNRLRREHVRMLERAAMSADALVINCLPHMEVCLNTFRERRQEEYLQREEQLKMVWHEYSKLYAHTDLPVIEYDRVHDKSPYDYQNRTPTPIINRGPGGGWWMPGKVFLLVGDRTNTKRNHAETTRVPFVSFSHLGCSGWLAAEFEDAGIDESELYWINAYEPDGTPTSVKFVDQLQPKHIFLMGRRAKEWLDEDAKNEVWSDNIQATEVPHPQYHKRFHSGTRYPLIDKILEIKAQ